MLITRLLIAKTKAKKPQKQFKSPKLWDWLYLISYMWHEH